MESQPQNPEYRNYPENVHPCRQYTTASVQTNVIWLNLEKLIAKHKYDTIPILRKTLTTCIFTSFIWDKRPQIVVAELRV